MFMQISRLLASKTVSMPSSMLKTTILTKAARTLKRQSNTEQLTHAREYKTPTYCFSGVGTVIPTIGGAFSSAIED